MTEETSLKYQHSCLEAGFAHLSRATAECHRASHMLSHSAIKSVKPVLSFKKGTAKDTDKLKTSAVVSIQLDT